MGNHKGVKRYLSLMNKTKPALQYYEAPEGVKLDTGKRGGVFFIDPKTGQKKYVKPQCVKRN